MKKTRKNDCLFDCKLCQCKCSYSCDWNRHNLTHKHLRLIMLMKNREKREKREI